ncbi:MAG: phosphoribosylglycinamide formyltransferase [Gemmatimonadaceae bacterium]
MKKRIAVLCSGGGSNLQALLDYFGRLGDQRAADVVLVASDRASAGALLRARNHGVQAVAMDAAMRTSGLSSLLVEHRTDLIVLAGYLRFIPNDVTSAFRGRIMNIHPSLLPAFGGHGMFGHHVHEAVLAAGTRLTGATVHFVDAQYDHGPIIAQWPVPVFPDDTVDELAERVLAIEHQIYPPAVHAVARGDVSLGSDGHVVASSGPRSATRFALTATADIGAMALDVGRRLPERQSSN